MSEKIYAWLLRLYPSHFRETYGEEALQLFRDRERDEKSLFPRLRLWVDLLADLAISVPREYYHFQPEFGASAQRLEGTPAFFVLEGGSPRPGALFSGGMLTLVSVVTLTVFLSQPVHRRPLRFSTAQSRSFASDRPSASWWLAAKATDGARENTRAPVQPAVAGGESKPSEAKVGHAPNAASPQSLRPSHPQATHRQSAQLEASQSLEAANPMTRGRVEDATIDEAERQRVIDGVVANLRQHYVYRDVAQKIADALLAHKKSGDYNVVTDGGLFAGLLTKQLRDLSQDMHLGVVYSEASLPERPRAPTTESLARYRQAMEQENCTFEKVEILPHNIGYLKLNSFPAPSVCESTARTAMSHLNDVDAIIFDLRDNRGGEPAMVMLMAAYLFDHPEYMYNPRENTTEQSWTRSPVPGNRLADKPVYVLTSAMTFSGAEHFSYDMKMLKRGTLVGETTGGAADVGVFRRIDGHFGIGIREARAINPYPEPDWAVVGVEPDVKVNAADALDAAIKLAQANLQKK